MITIEISSTDIRLMESEGERVVRWASRSIEADMFEEEVISDPQALSAAVRQLMTSSGIRGGNVIAGVSGLYSISRIVIVPNPLKGSLTHQTVLEAAKEVMPLSEDELYFSWHTVAATEGGQQVLVVGIPRDVIDGEVRTLRAAGLNPRILDLKTIALARAVNREQAIILNIEPTSFDVVIVVGGVAEVMRTTAWQQGDLTVEDKAEHLVLALELTAGFYNSHHLGFPLDPATPLFITGQMTGDIALMDKLQDRVGYLIEPLAPPLKYPAHLPVSQYAVNIGLALKGTAPSKSLGQGGYLPPDINFLPQVYRPWKPSARQVYFLFVIIAAIALLFPLYQVTAEAMGKTASLEARYAIVNSELGQRQVELSNREPLQKAIAEYHTIVALGGGFVEDLKVIKSISEEFGIEVVGSITHGGGSITFPCQADSDTTFRDYEAALKESGRFSSVTSSPALQEKWPPEYPDSGTITLKR